PMTSHFLRLACLLGALLCVPAGRVFAQHTAGGETPQSPIPIAYFAALPPEGQAPLPVRFEDHSFGPVTSWSWDFGDGAGATLRNASQVCAEGGIYPVRLTVSGPRGTNPLEKPRAVVVKSCSPQSARDNRPAPLERGEDWVPITGDDSLGLYCVYSG